MADLIVKAAVKEALNNMNVASDFYDSLDDEVAELLQDAAVPPTTIGRPSSRATCRRRYLLFFPDAEQRYRSARGTSRLTVSGPPT